MKKKVLFVATVVKTHINVFHLPYLQWFQEQEYETHVAARDDFNGEECIIPYCDKHFNIPFERSPLKKNNILSYKQLKEIIDKNRYDIIHCHTPVGAMLARLAAKKSRKNGTKVIYTAHGFHFFKGAPLLNWLIYFPVEFICSFFTDVLITINQEDYHLAKKIMRAKQIEYVPGVGIDVDKHQNVQVDKIAKRKELGIPENAVMLLSVGELSYRKNHQVVIQALEKLKDRNLHYCIVGQGDLEMYLKNMAKGLELEHQVHFLGFRNDINQICKVSDIFVFPSLQEGLPVALMEAMASGLPVICSDIRGNKDLIKYSECRFNVKSIDDLHRKINKLIKIQEERNILKEYNLKEIDRFSVNIVMDKMKQIYEDKGE